MNHITARRRRIGQVTTEHGKHKHEFTGAEWARNPDASPSSLSLIYGQSANARAMAVDSGGGMPPLLDDLPIAVQSVPLLHAVKLVV